jgi:RimJ/RimL family protein N-acetyltransferase
VTKLQTNNLILRPCTTQDAADFIALERDPEVMRYLNGGQGLTQEQSDPDAPFLMPRGTEPEVWTARSITNAAFIGWFCMWPESKTTAELGYRLSREHWGRGFASEGASALMKWGFETCAYEKIFASTMTVNHASRRVMEKIGMTHVRTFHPDLPYPIAGSQEGEVIYELTRTNALSLESISKLVLHHVEMS